MALHDHRWAFQPVNPCGLFDLLEDSLSLRVGGERSPKEITSIPMVEESDAHFRDKYLLREVLRKYPAFDLGVDTRKAARDAFHADEAVNQVTNDRLYSELPNAVIGQVLCLARKKIAEILGPFSEAEFWKGWRFGPKSTNSLRRINATVENKLHLGTPAVTLEALPLYRNLMTNEPMWSYCQDGELGGESHWVNCLGDEVPHDGVKRVVHLTRICQFDRFASVSKNAYTDRGIGVPPDVNITMQLSVGKMIRRRLHDAGVDLSDQTKNQELARKAALTGEDATVDVRSASQSIVCALVYNLLGAQPSRDLDWRWYWVMDSLRSPFTLIDGKMHENELFSAMGNGYTFELESLIFYGLAWACATHLHIDASRVSTYGDDIILPVGAYALLVEVFDFCGFRINENKSFHSVGEYRFRESCGKHYLNGEDVTPFYVDSPLDNPATIILAANNLVRWASKPGWRDGRVFPVWLYLVSHLGTGYLTRRIPIGEANDGLIGDWDECCPPGAWLKDEKGAPRHTYIGWKAKTVEMTSRPQIVDDQARYLRWQYHASGHSGWRPKAVPKLGGQKFSTLYRYTPCIGRSETVDVEPSLRIASEVERSNSAKVSLQLGSRVVTSWPWLGPWVCDDLVVDSNDVEIHARLRSACVSVSRLPVFSDDRKGNGSGPRSRR